jgi:hypothetical protein
MTKGFKFVVLSDCCFNQAAKVDQSFEIKKLLKNTLVADSQKTGK